MQWTHWQKIDGLTLRLVAGDFGLRRIEFDPQSSAEDRRDDTNPLLVQAAAELEEYFAGSRREFTLPLEIVGTDFQKRVWNSLLTIPYGERRSYGEIAAALGVPRAVRAVGAANGTNPLPIVIPCHRVIGARGNLVGYGGGLPLKKRLLDFERDTVHGSCLTFAHCLSIS